MIYVPGAHDPVVTPEEWEAYLKRRARTGGTPARVRGARYPLTGLARCGRCHHSMNHTPAKDGTPGRVLRCSRYATWRECHGGYIPTALAEDAVHIELQIWAADLESRAAVARAREEVKVTAQNSREQVESEVARVDRALVRLMKDRAADERTPAAVWDEARDELLAERDRFVEQLGTLDEVQEQTATDFGPILAGLLAEWSIMAVDRKRELLSKVIRHVAAWRPEPGGAPEFVVTPVWEACPHRCCAKKRGTT
jgi:hypothetical protein